MSKIGLLVCGNSGIDYIDHSYDIEVIRSILMADGKEYTDYVDISADAFYQLLEEKPELTPSTAQAATGVILEQYEKMVKKGYDELLVITISQKLSGTYEGCLLAGKMLDGTKVTVFDSQTVAYPEAKMTLEAARMIEAGKTVEEILPRLEELRDNHRILFSVKTLRYLVKNGRLSGASGFVGSMLKIKPMLEVTKDGRVEALEKIRTLKKATQRLVDKFLEELGDQDVEVFVIQAHAQDRANNVIALIQEVKPEITQISVYPLTPVVGAHSGPGVVGVGYIIK
ncbi:MAG: DegV family protein [Candidatus Izemoplasma sp.]|nr:DegV family protein [Candidatus Izemoplasma sp.]